MGDGRSARLRLPLLAAGQAQKEWTHNEALTVLDLLVQPSVVAAGIETPPAAPAEGECWILGPEPTGDWAGQGQAIAGWTAGGWRFVAAAPGMTAWVVERGAQARFREGNWAIAAPAAAIAAPSGGTTIDAESRAVIGALLSALRERGVIST